MTLEVKDCSAPWADLHVEDNGDVKPCRYASGILGSLQSSEPLSDIARNVLRRELQEFTLENRIHPLCAHATCSYVAGRPAFALEPQRFEDAEADGLEIDVDPGVIDGARSAQPYAMYLMAVALWMGGRHLNAMKWCRRGIDARERMSMHMMGDIHYHGYMMDAPDHARSFAFYQMSADLGYPRALMRVGEMTVRGEGVLADVEGGVALLQAAAERGEKEAWSRLAALIEEGLAPSQNPADDIARLRALAAA